MNINRFSVYVKAWKYVIIVVVSIDGMFVLKFMHLVW